MRISILLLSLFVGTAAAEESSWATGWDATLYGYASHTELRDDSVLNPDNHVARMAERSVTGELRMNLKAENDVFRLTARPILLTRETQTHHLRPRALLGLGQTRRRGQGRVLLAERQAAEERAF